MNERKILESINDKSKIIIWTTIGWFFTFMGILIYAKLQTNNRYSGVYSIFDSDYLILYIALAALAIVISFAYSILILINCLKLPDTFKDKNIYQKMAIASVFLLWVVLSFWFVWKTKQELAKYKKDKNKDEQIIMIKGDEIIYRSSTDSNTTTKDEYDKITDLVKKTKQEPYDFPPPKL